jgi:AcrR family transcriptional regulator
MTSAASSLRERQAEQLRSTILDVVIRELESRPVDDLSMGEVAAAAGISLRTLYRYFPDRSSLLSAAGQHVVDELRLPIEIDGPDAISASFLDAARRFADRPQLARALVQTTAGRAARSSARTPRSQAVAHALEPLTDKLDADTGRWAAAVIAHLCSLQSWVSIANDSGLDDSEAQRAVAWAIDTLVANLERTEPTRPRGRRSGSRPSLPKPGGNT